MAKLCIMFFVNFQSSGSTGNEKNLTKKPNHLPYQILMYEQKRSIKIKILTKATTASDSDLLLLLVRYVSLLRTSWKSVVCVVDVLWSSASRHFGSQSTTTARTKFPYSLLRVCCVKVKYMLYICQVPYEHLIHLSNEKDWATILYLLFSHTPLLWLFRERENILM